jgi:hypothetical protein
MIILKSTKFQRFSGNDRTIFKVSSKIYLDLIHYKKRKWIFVDISMVHRLHQIFAYIYIFKKIFKETQTCTVARSSWSEGEGFLATVFCLFSFFFMHCNLRGVGFPMRFSLFPCFFSVSFLYALYNGYLTWPWLPGPIQHVHPSSI